MAYGSLESSEHDPEKTNPGDPPLKTFLQDPDLPELPEARNGCLGTTLQIVNSMIGSGFLAFPSVVAHTGLLLTIVFTIFFCSIVAASCIMMVEAGKTEHVMDYSLLTEKVLGHGWRQANDLCVVFANLSCLCTYFNVIGALGSRAFQIMDPGTTLFLGTYPGFMVVFCTVVCLPLNMLRSYGELTVISAMSSVLVVATILFVCIYGQESGSGGSPHAIQMWPVGFMGIMNNLGTLSYATSCQSVVFEARHSMVKSQRPYFFACVVVAACLGCTYLLTMGIGGYAAFGNHVSSNVLLSFSDSDPAVLTGYILVVVHLLCYIPNDFIIARLFAFNFFGLNVRQVPIYQFVFGTIILFSIPLVLMAIVPSDDVAGVFQLIINLVGDLPTGFQCFVLPGLIYYKSICAGNGFSEKWVLAFLTAGIGLFVMIVCPVIDVISFVKACNGKRGCDSY